MCFPLEDDLVKVLIAARAVLDIVKRTESSPIETGIIGQQPLCRFLSRSYVSISTLARHIIIVDGRVKRRRVFVCDSG